MAKPLMSALWTPDRCGIDSSGPDGSGPSLLWDELLHEGRDLLGKGCAYCTKALPTWSTPDLPPVAPDPRAVRTRHAEQPRMSKPVLQAGRTTSLERAQPASSVSFGAMAAGGLTRHETTSRRQEVAGRKSTAERTWPVQSCEASWAEQVAHRPKNSAVCSIWVKPCRAETR